MFLGTTLSDACILSPIKSQQIRSVNKNDNHLEVGVTFAMSQTTHKYGKFGSGGSYRLITLGNLACQWVCAQKRLQISAVSLGIIIPCAKSKPYGPYLQTIDTHIPSDFFMTSLYVVTSTTR